MRTSAEFLASGTAAITEAALAAAGVATQDEADARIDEVLALAAEWERGAVPLAEVAKLTTPQDRFLVARFVRPQPPAFRRLIDALIVAGGTLLDGHGQCHEPADLAGVRHRRTYEDGPGGVRFARVHFQATVDELRRGKPGESRPADRSELAKRPAWRSSLPVGDR
jgi:hypothetical protein